MRSRWCLNYGYAFAIFTTSLLEIIEKDEGCSMRVVKGNRSNRRWHLSSALKLKGLFWQPKRPTIGLGM